MTAPKTPTSAEQAKATRMGRAVTSRQWLREQAYAVLAAVRTEEQFFDVLGSLGIKVHKRVGPETAEVTGYSLAAPGDTNTEGEPVYFGGSKLAPDLSLNRIRETLAHADQTPARRTPPRPQEVWRQAETALRETANILDSGDDAAAQAHLAAYSTLLHNTALNAPPAYRAELRAAATAFNRARRSAIRADHHKATALREAAKDLIYASHDAGGLPVAVIATIVHLAVAAARWYEQRGYQQQAAAAQQTLTHLQAGYRQAAAPVLADLTQRTPRPQTAQRELDTAHSPAEVLTWRITLVPNHRTQAAQARTKIGTSRAGPNDMTIRPPNGQSEQSTRRHR
ncbi:hypothetical protein ITX44_29005 [Streptomyces sp. KK5PA1]|uniref:Uncharacterized protein n=1 Tax=Actinacidiphila acididurans TaxID=2784346 RepID=A0ABS2U0G8_9ACTN|nr:hypothetical protein [Actinacidiphila acididurans]